LACSWRLSSLVGDLVEHEEDLHGEGHVEPISTRTPASTFRLISVTTISYQSSPLATTRQERCTKELAELGHRRSGGRKLDDGAAEDGGLAGGEEGASAATCEDGRLAVTEEALRTVTPHFL
jgi:hypothetical protein